MRVGFDGGRLNERGVAVSVFDYAFYARELARRRAGHPARRRRPPDPAHVRRFTQAFPTFGYTSDDEWQRRVERERVDTAYVLKTTRKFCRISKSSRTAVHEVFRFFRPHGDAYAYMSGWLAQEMTGGRYPCVPHMIDLPAARGDLRAELGLPRDAFVVGRHGAADTFDVPFAPRAIEAALERRRNLWLVLLNTQRFSDHDRILHLPASADRQRIADFIATCDVGINARRVGETFGLAIAEFLSCNKPVLVWAGGRDRNHLELVADPAFVYRDAVDLTRKLSGWHRPQRRRLCREGRRIQPRRASCRRSRECFSNPARARCRAPFGLRESARSPSGCGAGATHGGAAAEGTRNERQCLLRRPDLARPRPRARPPRRRRNRLAADSRPSAPPIRSSRPRRTRPAAPSA